MADMADSLCLMYIDEVAILVVGDISWRQV